MTFTFFELLHTFSQTLVFGDIDILTFIYLFYYHPQVRRGNAFDRVCLCFCMSLSVCPVCDLTFESLELELGAPAVPRTKTVPLEDARNTNSGGDSLYSLHHVLCFCVRLFVRLLFIFYACSLLLPAFW